MQCYTAVITPLNQCSLPMGCMTISLTIDASFVSWAVTSHRGTEGEHFGILHAHNAWTCLLCNATTAAWKDNARVDWRVTPWCNSHVIDGEMLWLSWAEGEAEKPNCSATTEDALSETRREDSVFQFSPKSCWFYWCVIFFWKLTPVSILLQCNCIYWYSSITASPQNCI